MGSKGIKAVTAILVIEIVGGLVVTGICYATSQYYKGRIDAVNEMEVSIMNIVRAFEKEPIQKQDKKSRKRQEELEVA